jgi:hypothetical protein
MVSGNGAASRFEVQKIPSRGAGDPSLIAKTVCPILPLPFLCGFMVVLDITASCENHTPIATGKVGS